MQFNDKITIFRPTNFIVQNWSAEFPSVVQPRDTAFLEIEVVSGTNVEVQITGVDESSTLLIESVVFTGPLTKVSTNAFYRIDSLVAITSGEYLINIRALTSQGEPIFTQAHYGPFLCSVKEVDVTHSQDSVAEPGSLRGLTKRVSIISFEPKSGDWARLSRGTQGTLHSVTPSQLPNFPKGWLCFLVESSEDITYN